MLLLIKIKQIPTFVMKISNYSAKVVYFNFDKQDFIKL